MPWFYTVLLIAISMATLAYTGYLLRCVLTAEPIDASPATATPSGAEPVAARAAADPVAATAGAEPDREQR